jgi:hypothetical protein
LSPWVNPKLFGNQKQEKNKMATENETKFVILARNLRGLKLGWLMGILNVFNVKSLIAPDAGSPQGAILLVEEGRLRLANELIHRPIGGVRTEGFNMDIAVIDLPDDSWFFRDTTDDGLLSKVVELYEDIADSTKFNSVPEVELPAPIVIQIENDSSNVVPIKTTVPEAEDAGAEEEDESWGIDDEEVEAEADEDDNAFDDDDEDEGPVVEDETEETQEEEVLQMEEGTEFQHADAILTSQPVTFPN